jgi:hypothetical protein
MERSRLPAFSDRVSHYECPEVMGSEKAASIARPTAAAPTAGGPGDVRTDFGNDARAVVLIRLRLLESCYHRGKLSAAGAIEMSSARNMGLGDASVCDSPESPTC